MFTSNFRMESKIIRITTLTEACRKMKLNVVLFSITFILTIQVKQSNQTGTISPTNKSPPTYEDTIPWPTYFWEIKPYIYTNEKGRLVGMIVDYFAEQRRVGLTCFKNVSNSYLISYTNKLPNRDSILGVQGNQSLNGYFLPIFGDNAGGSDVYAPLSATSVSIVAKQTEVELSHKLVKAVVDSGLLGVMVTLISTAFSLLYTAIEQKGKEKRKSWTEELFLAISFCVTTMSTVGYGDIVPSNQISRFISVHWMVFGLIISSLITGSITNFVYTDHDYLPPYRNKNIPIAVLNNSAEYNIAVKDFFADKVTNYSTYDEILDAVRGGQSKYAIINSDIAAYAQDTWNKGKSPRERLVVIFTKPITIPIQIGYRSSSYSMSDPLAVCVDYHDGPAKEYAYARNRKRVQTTEVYVPPMSEFILCYDIPRALLITCCTLIALGLCFDLILYFVRRQRQNRSDQMEINEPPSSVAEDEFPDDHCVDVLKAEWSYLKKEIEELNKIISLMVSNNKSAIQEAARAQFVVIQNCATVS